MNQIKIRKIRTAPNKYKIKAKCLIFASLLGLETLFHVDHKRLAMYISIVLTLMIGGSLFFSFWLLFILFIYLIFRLFIFPKEKKEVLFTRINTFQSFLIPLIPLLSLQ